MKLKSMIAASCAVAFFFASLSLAATADKPIQTSVAAAGAQVQESSWTGTVEQKEMDGKLTYVLTVGGRAYLLMPQEKAAEFEGKTVVIQGKLEGSTVTITTIQEA